MLVLTRKVGETIQIGENVALSVVSVKGRRVQLGIEAPAEIAIHRKELSESFPIGSQFELTLPERVTA